jgi:hypothetical protein
MAFDHKAHHFRSPPKSTVEAAAARYSSAASLARPGSLKFLGSAYTPNTARGQAAASDPPKDALYRPPTG